MSDTKELLKILHTMISNNILGPSKIDFNHQNLTLPLQMDNNSQLFSPSFSPGSTISDEQIPSPESLYENDFGQGFNNQISRIFSSYYGNDSEIDVDDDDVFDLDDLDFDDIEDDAFDKPIKPEEEEEYDHRAGSYEATSSESSEDEEPIVIKHKQREPLKIIAKKDNGRKRKRRRRKNLLKPGSQLYQFILQLLDDQKKQNEIAWVHKQKGIFKIVQKEVVAQRWGDFKERKMTYDSLSRGLRHYYQQGLLNSVNKKLHYQFTTKALEEWEQIRHLDIIDDMR